MCQSIEERGRRLPGRRRQQIKAFSASAQAAARAKHRSCGTAAGAKGQIRSLALWRRRGRIISIWVQARV